MKRIHRLSLGVASLFLGLTLRVSAAEPPFDFEVLQFRAKTLASKPYVPRTSRVPKELMSLSYDQHREIRYNVERGWWRRERLPFELQFFHPGFIFDKTIQVRELSGGEVTPIDFNSKLFIYPKSVNADNIPADMGFSGFRVHHELNTPGVMDEVCVFQGASYFRALGQHERYGLSARGLALNTADPGGEEFPIFEEFWVEKPAQNAKELVIYALLDGPSVAGAYRFVVKPGPSTVMEVRSVLYARSNANIKTLGIAPLTSMFWYGENSGTMNNDYRPEVHDSDGLLLERGSGEWLWRPLTDPAVVRTTAFADENPKGFGLIQRDRRFGSYEDLEACYHIRPSAWVEPIGAWGRGQVRLVELPTADETNDNIVAFWVPEALPAQGEPIELSYKLHWFMENVPGAKHPPAGITVATRLGRSKTHQPELQRFVVDFDSQYLNARRSDPEIEAILSVGDGAKLEHKSVEKNTFNGTWRVAFALRPDGSGRPVELRCFLRKTPHVLTETWTYLWQP